MLKKRLELILHPVRMRILMALSGEQHSPQELAELLPDVPQATLYRHIRDLAKGELIRVVEERPVRGTVEKVYSINTDASQLSEEDLELFNKEEHWRYYVAFIVTLLDDFQRYLQSGEKPNLRLDGVGYSKHAMSLSDQEMQEFGRELKDVVLKFSEKGPSPDRRKRLVSIVVMPDAAEKTSSG